ACSKVGTLEAQIQPHCDGQKDDFQERFDDANPRSTEARKAPLSLLSSDQAPIFGRTSMNMNYFQAACDRAGQAKVHKAKISTIERSSQQPSALRSVILAALVLPLLLLSPARGFSQQEPAARSAQPEESTIRDVQRTTLASDALVIQ